MAPCSCCGKESHNPRNAASCNFEVDQPDTVWDGAHLFTKDEYEALHKERKERARVHYSSLAKMKPVSQIDDLKTVRQSDYEFDIYEND